MSGICAVRGTDAARLVYLGLFALQDRGIAHAGIVSSDGQSSNHLGGNGQVVRVFSEDNLASLNGSTAIGQVSPFAVACGFVPVSLDCMYGKLSLAMEGRVFNGQELRDQLKYAGVGFQSELDAELILQLIAREPETQPSDIHGDCFVNVMLRVLKKIKGAFSLVILKGSRVYAATDPSGVWPLSLGQLDGGIAVASETCAFDLVNGRYLRPVFPGEIVMIQKNGEDIHFTGFGDQYATRKAFCTVEIHRRSRPDSYVFGYLTATARYKLGVALAKEAPVRKYKNTIVVPVPDSGLFVAQGYADALQLPYHPQGLMRSHYAHDSLLILPRQTMIKLKHNVSRDVVKGKQVVLIDAVMYSAQTLKGLVAMLKRYATKVHVRVSYLFRFPCRNGFDRPTQYGPLIAANHSDEEIREYLKADSFGTLSLASHRQTLSLGEYEFCTACADGSYME